MWDELTVSRKVQNRPLENIIKENRTPFWTQTGKVTKTVKNVSIRFGKECKTLLEWPVKHCSKTLDTLESNVCHESKYLLTTNKCKTILPFVK